jgi:hypothetical protein
MPTTVTKTRTAIPATRAGDAPVRANEVTTEVRRSPRFRPYRFASERYLVDRQTCKLRGSVALAEWRNFMGRKTAREGADLRSGVRITLGRNGAVGPVASVPA